MNRARHGWVVCVGLSLALAGGLAGLGCSSSRPPNLVRTTATTQETADVSWDFYRVASLSGDAHFRYPDGLRGIYQHGFRTVSDTSDDWAAQWGVRFDALLHGNRETELIVTIQPAIRAGLGAPVSAKVRVSGEGWTTVQLGWSAFAFDQAGPAFLRRVKEVTLTSSDNTVEFRNLHPVAAPAVALHTAIAGEPATAGQEAVYDVVVSNTTDRPQAVALSFVKYGWEVMTAAVEPANLQLSRGESRHCAVRVQVPDRVPPGGHEQQLLQAIPNGDSTQASQLKLVTVRQMPHPYVLHTPARWDEVRDRLKKYAWAKAAFDDYRKRADAWNVPDVTSAPGNDPNDNYGSFLFKTQVENDLLASAYLWQLTGDRKYAEKVATFLRRLSDPRNGYPVTLRGCNQSLVQEGGFFQHIAMAYDAIVDSGVMTPQDMAQIHSTFRAYIETIAQASENGPINNWNLAEVCGAFYCALAMQDLVTAERFFSGPAGIQDQLAKGTMDDGWWYECSISYNMWCASEFTQAALAYEPFGVHFLHASVPASYSPTVPLKAELNGGSGFQGKSKEDMEKPFGMDPTVFGPTRRPERKITDLWNSLIPFVDYRGIMFGVNDSTENPVSRYRSEVSGFPFEIAYYAYRDPRYATMIKLGSTGQRDLLYGVAELPASSPEEFRASAYADNVGLAMLRSQTPDRPIDQQIQAVLHYGTHGWAHGHFDRTNLLQLARYGRNFYNPESIWWGYEPFMYKFYVQTSINHNMVVVDQKMQEASPGERVLFYTGKHLQATAVETTTRWSNPPYGGMVYDYVPVKTFAEKCWREGRSVPIPDDAPAYGSITSYTEPIFQRRIMAMTDDYIVLADYVKGKQKHTYDSLLLSKGFLGLEAPDKKVLRHDAQWNQDPLGSAQFVTDCNWYGATAPSVATFETIFGPGEDMAGTRTVGNTPGKIRLGVHALWPAQQQIMVATAPESHNVEKRLFYTVKGNGKVLAEGKFGAWILGQGDIDVSLEGVQKLELETRTEISRQPSLFWVNAIVVMKDGSQIPLSDLSPEYDNIVPTTQPNRDYQGGPVKIAGKEYTHSIAAEPKDEKTTGRITVDLSKIPAARLKTTIGADYPPGPEGQRRKTFAIRSEGVDAVFVTLIEPYEAQSMVTGARAVQENELEVTLKDGRVQRIRIDGLKGPAKDLTVTLTTSQSGQADRTEGTRDAN